MSAAKALRFFTLAAVVVAVVMGFHLIEESKATSYLSSDPAACRVREWRLSCRSGLSVAPRFLWECLSIPTMTWSPSPATSNRT